MFVYIAIFVLIVFALTSKAIEKYEQYEFKIIVDRDVLKQSIVSKAFIIRCFNINEIKNNKLLCFLRILYLKCKNEYFRKMMKKIKTIVDNFHFQHSSITKIKATIKQTSLRVSNALTLKKTVYIVC